MTVSELIKHLQTLPQNLPVAYSIYSKQCLLEASQVDVADLCEVRPDGWIQNKRPDMPTVKYVLFP